MAIAPEDYESLSSRITLPQRPSRKRVEHLDGESKADVSDLLDPIRRQQYDPNTGVHHMRTHLQCEATHPSASGHSGFATHFFQIEGEKEHQQTPVCDAHLTKLMENSLVRGESNFNRRRIHPEDVAKHLAFRGITEREKIIHAESFLYSSGLRGEETLVGRTSEDLGKGGGQSASHLEELKARRTPEEEKSTLERALLKVREQGGHISSASPTVEYDDGESKTLGQSYAYAAWLRKKTEPENYYLQGVKSPDGTEETPSTPTRKFNINKAGAPNPRGGRTKKLKTETWDTSNDNVPGLTEAEEKANPKLSKERRASGVPVEGIKPRGFSKTNNRRTEVVMTQLDKEAPEVDFVEKYAAGRLRRVTEAEAEKTALNTEAERLRRIEARKTKIDSSRNAAFKIDWDDIPRP